MIGAIVGAVAAIASTAVNIGMSVKASKEAEKLNKKSSAGEQSALALQRMKTADIAGQGGMTAGQYSRALMQDDAYAMQVQGLTNKIESQSVFGDSFRKEAFYRLALSDIKGFTQKTASNLQDMDANMIVQNAQLSLQASSNLREAEGALVDRENRIKMQELEMKQAVMQNVAKGIASTAALVGAGMKYYDAQKKETITQQNMNTNIAQTTGIAGALDSQSVFKPQDVSAIASGGGSQKVGMPSVNTTRSPDIQPIKSYKDMSWDEWANSQDINEISNEWYNN
jgi:hypothetical protein